jgi:DNA-binding beta-propeller fold protein YncE
MRAASRPMEQARSSGLEHPHHASGVARYEIGGRARPPRRPRRELLIVVAVIVALVVCLGVGCARTHITKPSAPAYVLVETCARAVDVDLYHPWGVAVRPDGSVLLSEYNVWADTSDVLEVRGCLQRKRQFGHSLHGGDSTGLFAPHGIALASCGWLYVADRGNDRIVVLDDTLGYRTQILLPSDSPNHCAILDSALYVTTTVMDRVLKVSLQARSYGSVEESWDGMAAGSGGLREPMGIAVGPDRFLYVADSGHGRVLVFRSDGDLQRVWSVPDPTPEDIYAPYTPGIAVDNDGMVVVTVIDSPYVKVQVFDAYGMPRTELDANGMEDPEAVTVAPNGDVLVTDCNGNKVIRYRPAKLPLSGK